MTACTQLAEAVHGSNQGQVKSFKPATLIHLERSVSTDELRLVKEGCMTHSCTLADPVTGGISAPLSALIQDDSVTTNGNKACALQTIPPGKLKLPMSQLLSRQPHTQQLEDRAHGSLMLAQDQPSLEPSAPPLATQAPACGGTLSWAGHLPGRWHLKP